MEWIDELFRTGLFTIHRHCMAADPNLAWHHVMGNILIFGAYFMLPVAMIAVAVLRRKRFFGRSLWLLFGLFILFCGFGHLFTAFTISWWPAYRFLALWHYGTALISWIAFGVLVRRFDIATRLPSPNEYEDALQWKQRQIDELRALLKNYSGRH